MWMRASALGLSSVRPAMTKLHLPSRFSPGATPRAVEPHEHFVQLPTRLWKVLLAGGADLDRVGSGHRDHPRHHPGAHRDRRRELHDPRDAGGVRALARARRLSDDGGGDPRLLRRRDVRRGLECAAGDLHPSRRAGTFIAVGLIEELGKGAVLLAVAHQVHHREPRDGMVLGAVVGAGFAAFESAGYALQQMINNLDHQTVISIVELEAFRALLAPFGHITWTALLGGALFASSVGGRFRLTRQLLLTLVGVVILHAVWDQTYGWAVMLTKALVLHDGWQLLWPNAQAWGIVPTGAAMVWFNVFENALLAINGLIGASWLVHRWRTYPSRTRTSA